MSIHNNNKVKINSCINNQGHDNDDQLKKEIALLLIELKADASQSSPEQKRKSHNQNELRLKEVDFLIARKQVS